jgi:Xaa-Pro aminopeptidase
MLAPHSPALKRQIPRDESVRVAFGCAYEGYSGDVIRTYVIGKPSAVVKKLTKAYLEAQLACFDLIKPGVTNRDLVNLCTRIYTKHDVMAYWGGGIGHGLGITIHEPPRLQVGAVGELKQNMVIAVEPSLGGPDGGYAHCDVVRVTATGCENLSPGMSGLVVIDG